MMVKNEEERLHVSLTSVVGFVDALIIYDTGSTDNTIQIVTDFAEKHKINVYIIQGEFVNFSESRNVSLDYADQIDVHFLLLLDSNDELRGGENLRPFAKEMMTHDSTGFLTCQHWWSGQYDKYFNMRFVKNRKGWRYRGSVHEWMKDTTSETSEPSFPVYKMKDNIILYQDRTQDNNKSGTRFKRDKELLLTDHNADPTEPRILFYLGQTCQCLNQVEEGFYYEKLRSELDGFQEEKFHSFYRAGNSSITLKHNWVDSMGWYMKAFEHSERVEPLIKIAEHYKDNRQWRLAYTFASLACQLQYPHHLILFVDKRAYDYTRWHILGVVSYYVGKYADGKAACSKAIEQGINSEVDTKNLQFYLDKEREEREERDQSIKPINETKKQFMGRIVTELRKSNPSMGMKQMLKQANAKWKKR